MLANGASSHDAGTLHVRMRFGETLSCAAVCTLSFCGRKVHSEYSAQFASGSVPVEVVEGKRSHSRADGQVALAIKAASRRPGGRGQSLGVFRV